MAASIWNKRLMPLLPTTVSLLHRLIFYIAAIVLLVSLLLHAWITDDAYFSYRVVHNFWDGYGLRWNISERVQPYTNPLWTLLHIPLYALWPNHIALASIGLSLACAIASIVLVLMTFRLSPLIASAAFFLPLSLSPTLMSYFSSGLENPLTLLLFAWFGYEISRHDPPRWFFLSFIVSLAMTNRLDTILVYAPAMLYLLLLQIRRHRSIPWKPLLAGAWPILSWLAFSLFYYGSFFPNSTFAKIVSNVSAWDYAIKGWKYTVEFAYADPVMATIAALSVFLTFLQPFMNNNISTQKNSRLRMLCVGMLLYWIYVISVGGSYLSGLFLSLPAFMALWLFLACLPEKIETRWLIAGSALCLILYILPESSLWQRQHRQVASRILIRNYYPVFLIDFDFKTLSLKANSFELSVTPCESRAVETYMILNRSGLGAYSDGPCVHQIGRFVLGDALLARMPGVYMNYVGHIARDLPDGYIHAVKTGEMNQMDPALAEYYAPLRLIISGDLWDINRLRTILAFQLGTYDHWKKQYVETLPELCPVVHKGKRTRCIRPHYRQTRKQYPGW